MEFTGERVIPGQTDPDLMNEHWARYCFAEALVESKRVLDAGCGVAYGSAHLAQSAGWVYALDQAHEPLQNSAQEYPSGRLRFVQGDCRRLPFADASFDVVVAFEVIEHLEQWRLLVTEARRVLRPSGQLIVSTPNRLYYSESREQPNPFHVHEFDYDEFHRELGECFPHVRIFLQNHAAAVAFAPLETQGIRAHLEKADSKPKDANFFVAVCSMETLDDSPAFVYLPQAANVLREREHHIESLTKWLKETTQELEKLCEVHLADQKEAQEAVDNLEQLNKQKTEWAQQQKDEIASLHAELKKCTELIDDAEQRVIERTEWARRLDRELAGIYASRGYRISRRLRLAPEPGSVQASSSAEADGQPEDNHER